MRFIAFTVDRLGNPGHPTRRFDQIRKLKKRRQIRIIGGGVSGKPTVVLFLLRVLIQTGRSAVVLSGSLIPATSVSVLQSVRLSVLSLLS